MQNIALVFIVVILATILDQCLCHPYGAPSSRCNDMTPLHGPSPQTGKSPYYVIVPRPYYVPGHNVRVSIESCSDNIKGYLIQAREVGDNSAIGMFAAAPANGKFVNCGNTKVQTESTLQVLRLNPQ
jgi:hypothetical protein